MSSLMNIFKTNKEALSGHARFNSNMGISAFFYLLLGAALMYFFHIESPVFYIKKQQSQKAQDLIMQLRSESELTDETRKDFEDLQLMVTEDLRDGESVFDVDNSKSLSLMFTMKMAFVCTFNMPLNMIWLRLVSSELRDGEVDLSEVALSFVRFFTILIVMMVLDSARRTFAAVSAGFLSIIMLVLTFSTVITSISSNTDLMITLAFFAQFFSGVGIGLHVDVYSSECYSSFKKPLSIAHTVAVELAVQILLIFYHFYSIMRPHWILGVMSGVIIGTFIIVIMKLPHTARLSLVQSKNQFYSS